MFKNYKYKVSIITVSFNSEKTIEQTIKSVINQTYKNIEYIIIDGGSTDGTIEIIKKYQDNISYWVSEPDEGIYDAMNKGLAKAKGDIIGIINSDDWYDENVFGNVVEHFLNSDCDVVHGDIIRVYDDIDLFIRSKPLDIENIWHKTVFYHPTMFVKKDIYDKLGFFRKEFILAADYEFMLRLYTNGIKFSYLMNDIVYFRLGGASTRNIYSGYKEIRKISIEYGCNKAKANMFYYRQILFRKIYSILYRLNLKSVLKFYFNHKNKKN